ncbi:MAG: TonB-dependent receptor [Bacteroidota bacterium]
MTRTLASVVALCFFVTLLTAPSFAQSGKISGRVTDAGSGEPIPGANVIVVETGRGSAADLDGYYTILGVTPGTVTLRVTSVGFAEQRVEGVDVNIGQTATVNIRLREEDLGIETVVVQAQRPVVETDVSNSRLNVSSEEIEALPASDVVSVVGLQAGIQGLSVRGSGSDEISFQVNGQVLRDERNNSAVTAIPLASVSEVQVQTGGFNAEYGNVRSAVINVVTKEGDADRYSADVQLRISPATQKNFGGLANDLDSYWIRPFMDPEVAFTGTQNGAWSEAVQQQYPGFQGWIAVSEALLSDSDPSNDMTPEALQQAFLWQHRKSFEITDPDYDTDIGFGGPVPGISRALGNLRFYAAYRREEDLYLLPLHTDRYDEQTGQIKFTSNVASGMKLSVEGRLIEQNGTGASRSGQPGFFRSASGIASNLTSVSFTDSRIFSGDYWGPSQVTRNQVGATFTHLVSPTTFYEIRANRFATNYNTNPGPRRDETAVVNFGGVGFDEAPFGWQPFPSDGVDGMRMGVGMSNARDSTQVTTWTARGDLTSQLNRFMEVKTGLEATLIESNVNYARVDSFLTGSNQWSQWDRQPFRGAAYAQTKLEFQGMIANLGLRADYYAPGGEWYVFDTFDEQLAGVPTVGGDPRAALDSLLTTEPINSQLTLSPRLGVSFPVTSVSKLFFNYGHFRALPDSDDLYLVRAFAQTGQIDRIANPNAPPPRTIAYELGYEQSFFDQYLARVAGYYKDVSLQPRLVTYLSRSGAVDYSISEPNSFEDIRGFELTLSKNRGKWIRGFVNYTYMVFQSGYFGFPTIFENTTEQRDQENSDVARRRASSEPLPRPYARINLDLFSPDDFGPGLSRFRPLADWRVSFIGRWQDGGKATWVNGGFSAPGIINNVDVADFYTLDLRLARTFDVANREVTFFADVFNLLNRKDLSGFGYIDGNDRVAYFRSLHFAESEDYVNVPGNDVVGSFRAPDVPFQPLCSVESSSRTDQCGYGEFASDVIYYARDTESFLVFRDGQFVPADPSRVEEVLETRAYIDMPNQGFLTFLNPRDVFFGLRVKL